MKIEYSEDTVCMTHKKGVFGWWAYLYNFYMAFV